jgi:hypothetical protein
VKDAARTVRVGLCHADRFLLEVTTMSSKKVEPASLPIISTNLRYHLKPRPLEAENEVKENRKDRRSRRYARRRFCARKDGGAPGGGTAKKAGADPKVQAKPEPVSGWITRAEARSLLGVEETELAALITRFRLRQNWVEVYSKPEVLALREIVAKLR